MRPLFRNRSCLLRNDLLRAKKSWFFFDDEYVCLGTGIDNIKDLPAVTTINQCLLSGDVTVSMDNNPLVLKKGDHELKDVQWIYHNQVAYLFPEPAAIHLTNNTATGSWYRISHQHDTPKDEISMDVFTLWLDHGVRTIDGSYEYIVIPAIPVQGMDKYEEKNPIEILANKRDIQAVRHTGLNVCQVVFYTSGEIQIPGGLVLACNSQGMVMIRLEGKTIEEISVSDPSRKLNSIQLSVDVPLNKTGDHFKTAWDKQKARTNITIDLPQGNYAGKSVTLWF